MDEYLKTYKEAKNNAVNEKKAADKLLKGQKKAKVVAENTKAVGNKFGQKPAISQTSSTVDLKDKERKTKEQRQKQKQDEPKVVSPTNNNLIKGKLSMLLNRKETGGQ